MHARGGADVVLMLPYVVGSGHVLVDVRVLARTCGGGDAVLIVDTNVVLKVGV